MIFADLMNNYCDKVAQHKRGSNKEVLRIRAFVRDEPLAQVQLDQLTPAAVAEWRDRRLAKVSVGTVLREWNILSNACNVAVAEWQWMDTNPFASVRRPKPPQPRDTVYSQENIPSILENSTEVVGDVFRFALETAMRAGEITALTWADVGEKTATVAQSKNGTKRVVPLTTEARRILAQRQPGRPDEKVFGLTPEQLDRQFRKARKYAGMLDHHFHDARRTALTKMADKVTPMELAKISGHKDLKILLNTYYAPDMAAMADRLG